MFGRTTKAGSFLYFLSEQPGWTNDRVEAWERHHDAIDTSQLNTRFVLYGDALRMAPDGTPVFRDLKGIEHAGDDFIRRMVLQQLDAPIRLINPPRSSLGFVGL